ncbi:MAG: helicase associated domain-containing protein, partial [Bacilli bacterium]|nr:helicase associated domain-containing protein [Bacilli bacterium]
ENGSNLGIWLGTQKQLHKKEKLSEERKQLLEKIGINFITDDTTKTWNKMYDLAKSYYEHKDNLNIPQRFKTLNGYEYNEDGLKLGFWISNQRMFKKNNKLTIEKQKMLEMIGIVWNIKKNKEEINEICVKYNIDTNLNKKTINNISVKELVSKIEYLLSNNMPITIDEKLHEIFSMSSLNIKAKYGLNLEELVNQYYTSTKKEKGV